MPHRLLRLAVVLACLTAVLATTAPADASSQLGSLHEIDTANDGMNSPAVEWSGATYNADRHVLMTVDDEHNAYEFPLRDDGTIDPYATPRVLELDMGRSDFEGVAWIAGDTYAFLSEGDGEVLIVDVPLGADATIGANDVSDFFPVISGNWGNLGPEGIATDGQAFYVTREMPATLTKFDLAGNYVASVDLHALADASGVAVLSDGTFLVISHENRRVAHYDIDWTSEVAHLLATRDADLFTQLEGIAVMGNGDVYLFGEDNSRKGQTGQTYAHLQGVLVPTVYATADVNCSGDADLGDAILVARLDVGLIDALPGCGSGDHNGDGVVDLVDALLIAQCQVGLHNVGCPEGPE